MGDVTAAAGGASDGGHRPRRGGGRLGGSRDNASAPAACCGQCCPHCHHPAAMRWGKSDAGRQRWQCKGCERTFSATTKTLAAGLHEPEKLKAVLDDMLGPAPRSCRKLGAALGLDKMTVWAWRRRLSERLTMLVDDGLLPLDATASILARESRKASREWVDHARDPDRHPAPDRLRWADYRTARLPLPHPMARFQVDVSISIDRAGLCRGGVTPVSPTPCPTIVLALGAMPRGMARRPAACGSGTSTGDMPPDRRALGSHAPGRPVGDIHGGHSSGVAVASELVARLEQFLQPFRGPAIRHLGHYVGWFVARTIESDGGRWWNTLLGRKPTRFSDMDDSCTPLLQ